MTPAEVRESSTTSAPGGHIVPSGVRLLKDCLRGNSSAFASWRREPMTRRMLGALQDLVMHTPENLSTEDRLVQFGVSQGLMFAMQLMADPSAVWPGVFGQGTNEPPRTDMPVMDFDTSIDDAFDQ